MGRHPLKDIVVPPEIAHFSEKAFPQLLLYSAELSPCATAAAICPVLPLGQLLDRRVPRGALDTKAQVRDSRDSMNWAGQGVQPASRGLDLEVPQCGPAECHRLNHAPERGPVCVLIPRTCARYLT